MILVRKKTETGWWQGEVQASGTVNILLVYLHILDFRVIRINQIFCTSILVANMIEKFKL